MRVRITATGFDTEAFGYRTPIKFGGTAVDRATILNAWVRIKSADGRIAVGRGSMPLGNVWAFPSRRLSYEQTLNALLLLAEGVANAYRAGDLSGHPIEITHELERSWRKLAGDATAFLQLSEPVPLLAVLVAASPFDAALHDAYGKLLGHSTYQCLGRDFLDGDLERFLGREYAGLFLEQYVATEPVESLPLYHLVGALDPLTDADAAARIGDGWPETLVEWIAHDGLTHLKIKLNGDDLGWDLERVRGIHDVAASCRFYSLDFNERCPNSEYLLEFLGRLKSSCPQAYDRVQYVEQPTSRDLSACVGDPLHAAARLKPIVVDEGLTDYESLLAAREVGYSGVALKACKGQTQALLLGAAAKQLGMFLCVQDLTCPGASFVHSAGLATHVPGVAAVEGNARQYLPQANRGWESRFPGLFQVRRGRIRTAEIRGPGLGAYPP